MPVLKLNLPPSFFEEETRCSYTISAEMKAVWAVELDLLHEFMRVCSLHNIRWFADGGTILGAVRHQGIIPWDDDIDVMMLREDYDRFIALAAQDFQEPYFLQTDENSPQACRGHAQLRHSKTTGILSCELKDKKNFNQGIFLDIFPIDAIPDEEEPLQKHLADMAFYKRKLQKMLSLSLNYRFRWKRDIFKTLKDLCVHVSYRFRNPVQLLPIEEQSFCQRSWFDDCVYLPFETLSIPVPARYEELLDTFYGDWRTYVEGSSMHGSIIFDANRPYTDYLSGAVKPSSS